MIRGEGSFSWPGFWVILAGVILAIFTVVVGDHKPLNLLATSLLQAVSFMVALIGAYIFARQAGEAAGAEEIKIHARSAFRRQTGLFEGLGRLLDEIDTQVGDTTDATSALKLKILRVMLVEQLNTSSDALVDWRGLVPDEVAELEDSSKQKRGRPMTDVRTLRGFVARLATDEELVINLGSRDGVKENMYFDVLDQSTENIPDPVTGEDLGSIERVKAQVKIIKVAERLSIGRITYPPRYRTDITRDVAIIMGPKPPSGRLTANVWPEGVAVGDPVNYVTG